MKPPIFTTLYLCQFFSNLTKIWHECPQMNGCKYMQFKYHSIVKQNKIWLQSSQVSELFLSSVCELVQKLIFQNGAVGQLNKKDKLIFGRDLGVSQ